VKLRPDGEIDRGFAAGTLKALTLGAILLCYLFPLHTWTGYRNINEVSRIYLTQAIVDEGTLSIDDQLRRYGDVDDKAVHSGRFYTDKPVGLSFLSLPVYAVLRACGRLLERSWTLQQVRYALTVCCVSIPSLLLAALLLRYWCELTESLELVLFGVLAFALGTIACVYSTQFMGHQLGAVLAFGHFAWTRNVTNEASGPRLAAAGALAAFGAATDFFSVPLQAAIVLTYLPRVRRPAGWLAFACGALAVLAPVLAYNYLAFGNPLSAGYGHLVDPTFQKLHGGGLYGVTLPHLAAIWGLTLSPARGLFWLSPFLLIAPVGIWAMIHDPRRKKDGWLIAGSSLATFWLASSVVNWRLGWTVGPRAMVPVLPFLATAVVAAVEWSPAARPWFIVSGLLSILFVLSTTLTFPAFDPELANPLFEQTAFLLRRGLVSPNLGQLVGLHGPVSLLVPIFLVVIALSAVEIRRRRCGPSIERLHLLTVALVGVGFFYAASNLQIAPIGETRFSQAFLLALVGEGPASAKMFEEAVPLAENAEHRRSLASRAYWNAAMLHLGMGDREAARSVVNEWHEIDPRAPSVESLEQSLKTGRARRAH
jgi:hypothetical protein